MRRIANEAEGELKMSLREAKDDGARRGLLLAAGLITGEAILGILLAIPLAAWQGDNKIATWFANATGVTEPYHWPGLVILFAVMMLVYYVAITPSKRS